MFPRIIIFSTTKFQSRQVDNYLHDQEISFSETIPSRHRHKYLASRIVLKQQLSEIFCRLSPQTINTVDSYSQLEVQGTIINFSLSYSDNSAVLALNTTPIGVDIEKMKPRQLSINTIADAAEIDVLASVEDYSRLYTVWCLKEAAFKCTQNSFRFKDYAITTATECGHFQLKYEDKILIGRTIPWQDSLIAVVQ